MNILFLTDNFPPESNAPARRTFAHARHWVKKGHNVTIITGTPNFPEGKIFVGYKNKLFQREWMDGINVIRVWTFITPNKGFFFRLFDFLSFMFSASIFGLRVRKPDIIIGTSPQLFTVFAAWFLSKVKRSPFIFEVRDIWPESLIAVNMGASILITKLMQPLVAHLYKKASHIIVVTQSFKIYLVDNGVKPSKISVIYNGADLKTFKPIEPDKIIQSKLGLTDNTVVGYIGTHGRAHALGTLIEAAEIARKTTCLNHIKFISVGTGEDYTNLAKRSCSLNNLILVGQVSGDEVLRYWSVLDICITHLKAQKLFESVIPSKIFEAMAMGIPLLHGVKGESADLIEKHDVGICFEPENPYHLISQLKALVNDRHKLRLTKKRCVSSAAHYNREHSANQMLQAINKVVSDQTKK